MPFPRAIGVRRHRVTLLQQQTTTANNETVIGTPANLGKRWGGIEELSGREVAMMETSQVWGQAQAKITLPHDSVTATLRHQDQIQYVDYNSVTHTFEIVGPPINVDYQNRELVLAIVERI